MPGNTQQVLLGLAGAQGAGETEQKAPWGSGRGLETLVEVGDKVCWMGAGLLPRRLRRSGV